MQHVIRAAEGLMGGRPIDGDEEADPIFSALFLQRGDISPYSKRFSPGECICQPSPRGFAYNVAGSSALFFDRTSPNFPRDCLCIGGQRIDVTFLSVRDEEGNRPPFLVVPRGIRALCAMGHYPCYDGSFRREEGPLSALAFDSGSRVRYFGDSVFAGCARLTSVHIPGTVAKMGSCCFVDCRNLRLVTVQNGSVMSAIGDSAFSACPSLQAIDLPPDLGELSSNMFPGCRLCVLPLGPLRRLSRIRFAACQNNLHLGSVVIPGSVGAIDQCAFSGCAALSEVNFALPSKLVLIAPEAFAGCASLTRLWIGGSVESIAGTFCQGSGVHEVCIDQENTHFKAIEGCIVGGGGTEIVCYFGDDADVRIAAKIEKIRDESFRECAGLRSVTFETGSKIRVIESNAFRGCKDLERVQFAGLCPQLEYRCFGDCQKLKEVLFGSDLERRPWRTDAFYGCPVLRRA
jgi:hypothetical protein